MRLVLIWFATWKNAGSSYPPDWVKADPKRFPPMVIKVRPDGGIGSFLAKYMEQQGTGPLSPFGKDTVKADARAFAALMSHIKDVDPQHTVIMMQVENEIGSLGDSRDRSPMAEAAWAGPAPADLMNYLTKHKDTNSTGTSCQRASTWLRRLSTNAYGDCRLHTLRSIAN